MSESVVDTTAASGGLSEGAVSGAGAGVDSAGAGGVAPDLVGDQKVDADEQAQRTFSTSILISAVRCTLTYVLFPFVAPLIGLSSRVGPTAGVIIGVIAIVANLFSIRRFHRADHKWKWHMTTLNVAVIVLLTILLYVDITDLAG